MIWRRIWFLSLKIIKKNEENLGVGEIRGQRMSSDIAQFLKKAFPEGDKNAKVLAMPLADQFMFLLRNAMNSYVSAVKKTIFILLTSAIGVKVKSKH